MGVVGVVVVAGAVEVGGHERVVHDSVLLAVVFAELETGDLGDGVGFVGEFELGGEQGVFFEGLGRKLGVDAGGTEEEESGYAGLVGGVDSVAGDDEVLVAEVGGVCIVGVDTADLGGGHDHDVGFFGLEEGLDVGLAG